MDKLKVLSHLQGEVDRANHNQAHLVSVKEKLKEWRTSDLSIADGLKDRAYGYILSDTVQGYMREVLKEAKIDLIRLAELRLEADLRQLKNTATRKNKIIQSSILFEEDPLQELDDGPQRSS